MASTPGNSGGWAEQIYAIDGTKLPKLDLEGFGVPADKLGRQKSLAAECEEAFALNDPLGAGQQELALQKAQAKVPPKFVLNSKGFQIEASEGVGKELTHNSSKYGVIFFPFLSGLSSCGRYVRFTKVFGPFRLAEFSDDALRRTLSEWRTARNYQKGMAADCEIALNDTIRALEQELDSRAVQAKPPEKSGRSFGTIMALKGYLDRNYRNNYTGPTPDPATDGFFDMEHKVWFPLSTGPSIQGAYWRSGAAFGHEIHHINTMEDQEVKKKIIDRALLAGSRGSDKEATFKTRLCDHFLVRNGLL